MVVHEKIKSFTCPICKEAFSYKHSMERHFNSYHVSKGNCKLEPLDKIEVMEIDLTESKEEKAVQEINNVRKDTTSTEENTVYEEKRPFKCVPCNVSFETKGSLKRHIILSSRHKDEKFEPSGRELKKEKIEPSVPKMPHKCSFCGLTYTLENLAKHLLNVHGEMSMTIHVPRQRKIEYVPRQRKSEPLKSYNCPSCNFTSFRGQIFLDKHIEEDHGGKKLAVLDKYIEEGLGGKKLAGYYCEICKSLYDEKSVFCHDLPVSETLDFHTLDEKMYDYLICGICDDKTILSKEGLADHLSAFHDIFEKTEPISKPIRFMPNEDQNIQKCLLCSKNFLTKHGLDEHITSDHGGRQLLSQEIDISFPQKPNISPSQNLNMISLPMQKSISPGQNFISILKKPNFPLPQKPLRVLKPKVSYSKNYISLPQRSNISLIQKPMIPVTQNLTIPLPSKPTLPTWLPSPSSLGLRF